MEIIILGMMTIVICCVSIGLFALAADRLEQKLPWKLWSIMSVYFICVSCVLYGCYHVTNIRILKFLCIMSILWICGWTDYKKHLILNKILAIGFVMRFLWLAIDWLSYGYEEWLYLLTVSVTAALMLGGALLLCKLVSPGSVGFGDVKLLIVFGLYTGVELAVNCMIDTFLVMFVTSVILLLQKKVTRKTSIAFAPFLVVGTAAASLIHGI